jgi:hypothetical protein
MQAEPVIITIFFFTTIAVIWGAIILTRHKERMTMLEKATSPDMVRSLYEKHAAKTSPLSSLKWGMIFVALGAAALLGLWFDNVYNTEEGMYFALMAVFGGAALIVFYFIAAKKAGHP